VSSSSLTDFTNTIFLKSRLKVHIISETFSFDFFFAVFNGLRTSGQGSHISLSLDWIKGTPKYKF
jgi:hypothetical protein